MITSTVATIIHALSPLLGVGGAAAGGCGRGRRRCCRGGRVCRSGRCRGGRRRGAGACARTIGAVRHGLRGVVADCRSALRAASAPASANSAKSLFMSCPLTALARRFRPCGCARPVRDRRRRSCRRRSCRCWRPSRSPRSRARGGRR